jgi:hypothetical protein
VRQLYPGEVPATDLIAKCEDRLHRSENPCIKAIRSFVAIAGNRNIADITASDMRDLGLSTFSTGHIFNGRAAGITGEIGKLTAWTC